MAYICPSCSKQFALAEALAEHQKQAHGSVPQHSSKGLIIVAAVVVAIIIGYYGITHFAPSSNDAFAQCITASGAKFYGAFWCPHCEDQKKMFGTAARYLPYVECSNSDRSQNALCQAAGIDSYPTWVFPDGSRINIMTFAELGQKTGCEVPAA